MVATTLAHEFGSVAMALGYVGVWSLIVHAGLLQWLTAALAKLGRMALTNYLMQTLVATFVMYWWGLGWFGDVSRPQQIMLVLGIYVSQIILSMIWLSVFRMGPMEWLWRSLSYGRVQPVWKSRQTGS
jgi:uncharacterized protein